jgi:predicted XRE-type DNA-binding protein
MTVTSKSAGKQQRFNSVWDAIEAPPAQAENMKLRSALMLALKGHIANQGLSQSKAAKLFVVTQPRISDLMRGCIDLFAIDTLVNMLTTTGLRVELHIAKAA